MTKFSADPSVMDNLKQFLLKHKGTLIGTGIGGAAGAGALGLGAAQSTDQKDPKRKQKINNAILMGLMLGMPAGAAAHIAGRVMDPRKPGSQVARAVRRGLGSPPALGAAGTIASGEFLDQRRAAAAQKIMEGKSWEALTDKLRKHTDLATTYPNSAADLIESRRGVTSDIDSVLGGNSMLKQSPFLRQAVGFPTVPVELEQKLKTMLQASKMPSSELTAILKPGGRRGYAALLASLKDPANTPVKGPSRVGRFGTGALLGTLADAGIRGLATPN